MANVIQLNRPSPVDYVNQFVQNFSKSESDRKAEEARQQQLAIEQQRVGLEGQRVQQEGAYQQGTLQQGKDTLASGEREKRLERVVAIVKQKIDEGDRQGAAAAIEAARKEDPTLTGEGSFAAYTAGKPNAAETARGNAWQTAAGATGRAAAGGTDPNDVNLATKMTTNAFMPTEGFGHQEAIDLANRLGQGSPQPAPPAAGQGGGATAVPGAAPTPQPSGPVAPPAAAPGPFKPFAAPVPKPSGNAVIDSEARNTGALPSSANSLTSQTQVTTEGMRGQTQRATTAMQVQGQKDIEKMKLDAAKIDPGVANTIVSGVLADPQSYFGLPNDSKKVVLKTLNRAPSKLSAVETERSNAAMFGRQLIDDADTIVKKWQGRGTPITGPVLGRFNAAEGKWGDMLIPKNLPPEQQAEYSQDISQLREWLTALPIMEAKALAGGRTAYQVIEAVTSAAPALSKGKDMFEGSVKGLRTRFAQIEDTLDKKQWGGQVPSGYKSARERMGGADPTQAPKSFSMTATGPNGHKIGSNDGNSWFDVQTGQQVK